MRSATRALTVARPTTSARALLLAAFTPLLQPCLLAQEPLEQDLFEERVEVMLQRALTEGELEGATLAIALGDETLYQGEWGAIDGQRASVEGGHPAGPLTEILTVASVLRLAERGEIDLDAEVSTYLPGLTWSGGAVRVRHLLAQTSGISNYMGPAPSHRGEPTEEELASVGAIVKRMEHLSRYAGMLTRLKGSSLEHDPGTCLTYSNSNVLLAAVIVEAVSGEELHDFVPRTFFEPLDLGSTEYVRPTEEPSPRKGEQEVGLQARTIAASFASLAGLELRTSAVDLLRWQRALLEREVLGEASTDLMLGEHLLDDGSPVSFGYGTGRTLLGDLVGVTYGGRAGAQVVHVAHYPGLDLTLAMMGEGSLERAASLERRIVRALFDLPGEGVDDRPLSRRELDRYAGNYQMGCNRILLRIEEASLLLDSAIHPQRRLFYQGGNTFVAAEDHDFRLIFQLEPGERAHALILDEAGIQSIASRIPD